MNNKTPMYKKVGPYFLIKEIGYGSFARVFKSTCENNQEEYAIKMVQKNNISQESLNLIDKEIEILLALNHPNIIKLIDFKKTENNWYLVFEYCVYGDLEQYMKKFYKGKFPEQLAQQLFQQIVEAFKEIRRLNIVHRDLKLANILINKDFQVKLADFGFAKYFEDSSFLQSYCGTPITMAYEVLTKQRYNEKCDIWSLGIIIYQMIYGVPPFNPSKGQNLNDLIAMIKNQTIQFPNDVQISDDAKDLIKKMLVLDPENRISFNEFFSHNWIVNSIQQKKEEHVYKEELKSMYIPSPKVSGQGNDFLFNPSELKISSEIGGTQNQQQQQQQNEESKENLTSLKINQFLGQSIILKIKKNFHEFSQFFEEFKEIIYTSLSTQELTCLGCAYLLKNIKQLQTNKISLYFNNNQNSELSIDFLEEFKQKFMQQSNQIFTKMLQNLPNQRVKNQFERGDIATIFWKYLLQQYNEILSQEDKKDKQSVIKEYKTIQSCIRLMKKQQFINDQIYIKTIKNSNNEDSDINSKIDLKLLQQILTQYQDNSTNLNQQSDIYTYQITSRFQFEQKNSQFHPFMALSTKDIENLESDISKRILDITNKEKEYLYNLQLQQQDLDFVNL